MYINFNNGIFNNSKYKMRCDHALCAVKVNVTLYRHRHNHLNAKQECEVNDS